VLLNDDSEGRGNWFGPDRGLEQLLS